MAKMNRRFIACAFACACLATTASAHSVRATMDGAGNRASFTGLARVTCFDDGSGSAALLTARIRDNSPAVAGLIVNLQLVRGGSAISISDGISGDEQYSESIALPGGNGEYIMMVNKTAAGARSFDLEWHCVTAGGIHTGTDVTVQQFQ